MTREKQNTSYSALEAASKAACERLTSMLDMPHPREVARKNRENRKTAEQKERKNGDYSKF